MSNKQYTKGLIFTFLGVLALGPDALLVRLIGLEHWTLLFWRGLFIAIGILVVMFFRYREQTGLVIRNNGRLGILIACLFTCSTICFISALTYTSVAHTLVIISAAPVFAALLSRIFLSEPIQMRTMIVMGIVMAAISLMVANDQDQYSSLFGDMLAILTAVFLSSSLVVTRQAREFDMTPSIALSGVLTALIVLPFANPLEVSSDAMQLLILLSLLLTFSFVMFMLGPRYIPAPEVSLMLPIETVTGIALVWWVIGEAPSNLSIIGGVIIISCLMINSLILIKSTSKVDDIS